MESLNLAKQSKQSKLNFLSGMEWMVGRVLKEISDLVVEVGESLQVVGLQEEWGGESPTVEYRRRCKVEWDELHKMLEHFDKKDWERKQRRCADPLKVFNTQFAESARGRRVSNLRVRRRAVVSRKPLWA